MSADREDFKTNIHKSILPSCCGNTSWKTEHNERSAENGRGYTMSLNVFTVTFDKFNVFLLN